MIRLDGSRLVGLVLIVAILLGGATASAQQTRMSLQQCIDQALQENTSVVGAELNYKSSREDYLNAWGKALPSAYTSANYNFNKGVVWFAEESRNVKVDPNKSYSARFNLSMTLFDGGYTWFNINRAGKLKSSSKSSLRETVLGKVLEVKMAYYYLVSTIMLRDVQADALERSKKQLEVTATRYELGSASLSEKLKQEVNVANDSLALLERVNDIRNAEFTLSLLMNRDVSESIVPTDALKVAGFDLDLDQCVNIALGDNPSLKRAKANLDAAKAGVRMSRASWIPNVSASLGWNWSTQISDNWFKYQGEDRGYNFSVSIGYNLFDAFSKKTNYTQSKLLERNYREEHKAQINSVAKSVRQAYLDIEKSQLQYETALLLEKSAEEDLKLQEEKYRLGASSILELLDAQYSLTSAQYTKVQALYSLNVAVASMSQALGRM